MIDIYKKWEEGSFSFEPEYTMESKPNKFLVLDQLCTIKKLFSKKGEEKKLCSANNEKTASVDVQAKLDAAFPYYFFLSSIEDSPETHNDPQSITFGGDFIFIFSLVLIAVNSDTNTTILFTFCFLLVRTSG